MAVAEVAWLVGLLEGEGYFGVVSSSVAGKRYRYPRIGINMTDRDVLERVAGLWGVSIYVMHPAGVSKKVSYRATLVGSRAAHWMRQLLPLMGQRRRAQIEAALSEWDAIGPANERRRRSCSEATARRVRRSDGTFVTPGLAPADPTPPTDLPLIAPRATALDGQISAEVRDSLTTEHTI